MLFKDRNVIITGNHHWPSYQLRLCLPFDAHDSSISLLIFEQVI